MAAQADPPAPSTTVDRSGLDVMQGEAAASVAGHDRLVLVVGPAGAGKTRMLTAAANDLDDHGRVVFGWRRRPRPPATSSATPASAADTVAKLLHEWQRTDRPPLDRVPARPGATLIVDEAGMLSTPALHQVVTLADSEPVAAGPRSAIPASCKASAAAACSTSCAPTAGSTSSNACTASRIRGKQPRRCCCDAGDPRALRRLRGARPDHRRHPRRPPGPDGRHLDRPTTSTAAASALVASTNDHVDTINQAVQQARLDAGHLDPDVATRIAGGEHAHVGDVVATRRNDRRLITTAGEPVRNRDTWTVTAIGDDGSLTVSHHGGTRRRDPSRRLRPRACPARLRGDRARLGVRQRHRRHRLASSATTRRGLYVAVTRGSEENVICVITDSDDIAEARDVLDGIVAIDRADIPAVTQRRSLAQQLRDHAPSQPAPPAPRCVIPDWFPSLLHDARNDLTVAEQRATARAAQRQRLLDAIAAADSALDDVAAATAPDRDAHASAVARADDARRHQAAAQRRVDTAPRRARRSLRHELDVAERRLERADAYLERTRQRTEPSIEQYRQAQAHRRAAARQPAPP